MCIDEIGEISRHDYNHIGFAAIFVVIGLGMILWAIRTSRNSSREIWSIEILFLETLPPPPPGGSLLLEPSA